MPVAKILGSLFGAAFSMAAVGCADLGADVARDDEGQVSEEGEIGALRIQVGDCLGDLGTGVVESATAIPCEETHYYEVYHSFDLPDGDFPGPAVVGESADDGCLAAFSGFVGTDFQSSIYGFTSLTPTDDTWNRLDDRAVLCMLSHYDGTDKTGTARNTAQ